MKRIGPLKERLKNNPYIHRIELLERFYKFLDKKELIFVNPDKWEDPLENLIFNAKILKDGKNYINPAKDNIFSQCWSYEGDSYALWKIYTTKLDDNGQLKRHMGVRITTNLDRLQEITRYNDGDFYYGIVKYLWKYQLDKLPKNKKIIDSLKITQADKKHIETLLIKRKSYSYEKELRLFSIPNSSLVDKNDKHLCRLNLKPLDFITSIRFDPGMEYPEFIKNKNKLIDKYGFKRTQITQSTFFKKNKYIIKID